MNRIIQNWKCHKSGKCKVLESKKIKKQPMKLSKFQNYTNLSTSCQIWPTYTRAC